MNSSMADSEDDLASFLAGLRQRYNLPGDSSLQEEVQPTQPLPAEIAESCKPASSTDARLLGMHSALCSVHSSYNSLSSKQHTETGGHKDPELQQSPEPTVGRLIQADQQLQHPSARPDAAAADTPAWQQKLAAAAAVAAMASAASSEAGSCATPSVQQSIDSQWAIGILGNSTPADTSGAMVTGGAVAAAGTPYSTAAMPAARMAGVSAIAGMADADNSADIASKAVMSQQQSQSQQQQPGQPDNIQQPLFEAFSAAAGNSEEVQQATEATATKQQQPNGTDALSAPQQIAADSTGDIAMQQMQAKLLRNTAAVQSEGPDSLPGVHHLATVSDRALESIKLEQVLQRHQQQQQQDFAAGGEALLLNAGNSSYKQSPASAAAALDTADPPALAAIQIEAQNIAATKPAAKVCQDESDRHARPGNLQQPVQAIARLPEAAQPITIQGTDFGHDSAATVLQATAQDPAAAAAAGDPDTVWQQISSQLAMAGFGPLAQVTGVTVQQRQHQMQKSLQDSLLQVLREYRCREGLTSQLLTDRDELRREAQRSMTEYNKMERQHIEAHKAYEKAKAELADVRNCDVPALDAKHKEALAKLSNEIARLKHALKEAEQAEAIAQQAAAGDGQAALLQQLQATQKDKDKASLEGERLASELTRQKSYIKELEKAAAAARSASRQSDEQVMLLERQLRELRQQQQDEVATLTAELTKARHTVRETEQQLIALRAEGASDVDAIQQLNRHLAVEQVQHEEQRGYLTSELNKLKQQLQQLQQSTAKAEASAKVNNTAAAYNEKQLVILEKQHIAEVQKLQAEAKQAREAAHLAERRLQQAEVAVAEQLAAANRAAAAALEDSIRATAATQELDRVKASSRQQLLHVNEQLTEARRELAEAQQQLLSNQAELRRLRAAAGLADATATGSAAPAAAGPTTLAAASAAAGIGSLSAAGLAPTTQCFHLQPPTSAGVVLHDMQQPPQQVAQDRSSGSPGLAAASSSQQDGSGGDGDVADLAAALGRAVRAEAAVADAEAASTALRYKALQLEASVSRKEREIDALRDRLGDKVTKEERRLARDKQVYTRIRQAYAASKRPAGLFGLAGESAAVAARRAAAGAVAAAARELRPIELVSIYENQKEPMEKELAAAKAEVRVLNGQLRDAQNLLITKDRAAAVAAAAAGLKGLAAAGLGDPTAVMAAQRKAAELQRELCSVRGEAAVALREAAKRLAEADAQIAALKTDNEALTAELDSRPTHQEHRQLKREIDILQRKIASLRRQAAIAAPGGMAAAGEDDLTRTTAAGGEAWPPGEGLDGAAGAGSRNVGAAVARDKAIAKLSLRVVEEYPRDVLVDLVQDVCVVLELSDATLLVPNLRKMVAVVAAIPKLEAFIAQVCSACFRKGIMFVPPAVQQNMNPGTVPQVLQHWVGLLQQHEQLQQLADQLQQLLAHTIAGQPEHAAAANIETEAFAANKVQHRHQQQQEQHAEQLVSLQQTQQRCQQLLSAVQHLLQVESEAVAAADVLDAARGLVATHPEGLLQQLLLHVQQLFDIPSLEGLPAAMNKVYVHYGELVNFFKAVSSVLGLPDGAGPIAAMDAIRLLAQQAQRSPSKVRIAAGELQKAASRAPSRQAAAPSAAAADADSSGQAVASTDAAPAAATAAALQAVLTAVGAGSVQEVVHAHRDMKQRLERLDQVLPRYQRLASQLYEQLRVVSLDEIIPAVDTALKAAAAAQ